MAWIAASSLILERMVWMKVAICFISGSFMPREVTAGEPRRRPLVWKGERVSLGTVFLLVVMLAISRAI